MNYLIRVNRETRKLTFKNGSTEVQTNCWWDKDNVIPAQMYHGCSNTRMRNKRNSKGELREAIYLPDHLTGHTGIFIHMGTGPGWSDGCIVIEESELLKIWNDIDPMDGRNVSVEVIDRPLV